MNYIYEISGMGFDCYIGPEDLKDPDAFDDRTEVIYLFYYMVHEARNLKIGEEFLIRDLFKGYIWNRLSQAQKATLGRLVSDYICSFNDHGIEEYYLSYSGRTKQGQMILKLVGPDDVMHTVPRKGPKTSAPKLSQFKNDVAAYDKAFAMWVAENRSRKNQ